MKYKNKTKHVFDIFTSKWPKFTSNLTKKYPSGHLGKIYYEKLHMLLNRYTYYLRPRVLLL